MANPGFNLFLMQLDTIEIPYASRVDLLALLRRFQGDRLWFGKRNLAAMDVATDVARLHQSGHSKADIVKRIQAMHSIGRTQAYKKVGEILKGIEHGKV